MSPKAEVKRIIRNFFGLRKPELRIVCTHPMVESGTPDSHLCPRCKQPKLKVRNL